MVQTNTHDIYLKFLVSIFGVSIYVCSVGQLHEHSININLLGEAVCHPICG
jgi:hypothetical protein